VSRLKLVAPFTVHYNLKQQFWVTECQVAVTAYYDKVFDQLSGALKLNSISLSSAYQSCVTNGAIETVITMNGVNLDKEDPLKKLIDSQVDEMRKRAFDLVKTVIFDVTPSADPPATSDKGFFSEVFGGLNFVSLKSNYQRTGLHTSDNFTLNGTIVVYDTKSGDLNDLEPAIRANLDKYLAIVEIDEYFKKIQVAAYVNIAWSEILPDGTNLSDPVKSAQIEVGYPDLNHPLGPDGKINFQFRADGLHYTVGHREPLASELALWTKDNGADIINIAFLKLSDSVAGFGADEVIIRKTISYDPLDPRVELSSGSSNFVREVRTKSHAPVITADEAGYLYVKFLTDRPLRGNAIVMTLTCKIGSRKDTITITSANQKNVLWEIFSDKYINETFFTYDLQVEVVGPNFTDDPVSFGTPTPISVPLPSGRVKYISPFVLPLPPIPVDKKETIERYIRAGLASLGTVRLPPMYGPN